MPPPTVCGPGETTPPRGPASIRRTSTIDVWWPAGWGTQMRALGRARDLLTPAHGDAVILAADEVRVGIAPDRTIEDIASVLRPVPLGGLVGARGGSRLRQALAAEVPQELAAATPLYLLLDDLAGVSLVAGFAFSQWPQIRPDDLRRTAAGRRMEGVCIGFRPGSSAMEPDGAPRQSHDIRRVAPLGSEADPLGWHLLPEVEGVSMRRARRIDVRITSRVEVDAVFQDSATTPSGHRAAVHEYQLHVTANAGSGRILSIEATPRVLPYPECPLAVTTSGRLVGSRLSSLREAVLAELKGTAGCTHLNDMLRALAEVPALARYLGPDSSRRAAAARADQALPGTTDRSKEIARWEH